MRSFYEILGVRRDASVDELRHAYYQRVKEAHPDHGGDAILFMNVRKGYSILANKQTRQRYDKWLASRERMEQFRTQESAKDTSATTPRENTNTNYHQYNTAAPKSLLKLLIALLIIMVVGAVVIGVYLGNSSKDETEVWQHEQGQNTINKDQEPYTDEYYNTQANATYDSENSNDEYSPEPTDENGYIIMPSDIMERKYQETSPHPNSAGGRRYDEPTYEVTNYSTGDIPYNEYFGRGSFDDESLSQLEIQNFSNNNAVVLLVNSNGKVIRNNFVYQGAVYIMKHIPASNCIIRIMFGHKWNRDKDNGSALPKGGFMEDVSFMRSEWEKSFMFYPQEDADGISYPTYSVTLHSVKGGNFKTQPIDKNSFFER